jgi:signal transduction histidine kinase
MRFIRPLKEMTLTSQKITESPRASLLREVAGLAQRLDLRRRDEVGDIARASKRLFEELISFQEELEQRVSDRTRELRRTNIELEKANDKLKSLSHEKDAFVAKVSHDLRQPLNAIFLQVEALKLSKLDETQQKDVQRIRDHAARELNLVNDILEYQKIIMGAETLHRNTVEVAAILEELDAVAGGNGVSSRP